MNKPILYIKSSCPWCQDALSFFKSHSVTLEIKDVLMNPSEMSDMQEASGQNLTPTFVYEDCVIADFSVDEFKAAIKDFPEVMAKIGLSLNQ